MAQNVQLQAINWVTFYYLENRFLDLFKILNKVRLSEQKNIVKIFFMVKLMVKFRFRPSLGKINGKINGKV